MSNDDFRPGDRVILTIPKRNLPLWQQKLYGRHLAVLDTEDMLWNGQEYTIVRVKIKANVNSSDSHEIDAKSLALISRPIRRQPWKK